MTQQLKHSSPAGQKLTFEEFLEWDGDNQHVEWVDGEVISTAPVGDSHQNLRGFLFTLLRTLAEERDLGVVRDDPFQMKTGPDLPGRAPDIFFVVKERLHLFKSMYFDGPADLVIEIVSPGSRTVDHRDKFREYERGGVKEYWILDPDRKKAEFFRLGQDGRYAAAPAGTDGVYHSSAIEPLGIPSRLALASAIANRFFDPQGVGADGMEAHLSGPPPAAGRY